MHMPMIFITVYARDGERKEFNIFNSLKSSNLVCEFLNSLGTTLYCEYLKTMGLRNMGVES